MISVEAAAMMASIRRTFPNAQVRNEPNRSPLPSEKLLEEPSANSAAAATTTTTTAYHYCLLALQVRFSSLDAFVEALLAFRDQLPVITQEIGDTWIYGIPH